MLRILLQRHCRSEAVANSNLLRFCVAMFSRYDTDVRLVGNYGTGKSHLMSALAAVAEFPGLHEQLRNPAVAAAAQIAGKFKVWRAEVGGVTGSLRNIILSPL